MESSTTEVGQKLSVGYAAGRKRSSAAPRLAAYSKPGRNCRGRPGWLRHARLSGRAASVRGAHAARGGRSNTASLASGRTRSRTWIARCWATSAATPAPRRKTWRSTAGYKAQLARPIRGLRDRGLLAAVADDADRRSVRLSLTADGRALQRTLQQQARGFGARPGHRGLDCRRAARAAGAVAARRREPRRLSLSLPARAVGPAPPAQRVTVPARGASGARKRSTGSTKAAEAADLPGPLSTSPM